MRYKNVIQYYAVIGVYIIYWKDRMGRSILDVIHNAEFDMSDTSVNHGFIINYFKQCKLCIWNKNIIYV